MRTLYSCLSSLLCSFSLPKPLSKSSPFPSGSDGTVLRVVRTGKLYVLLRSKREVRPTNSPDLNHFYHISCFTHGQGSYFDFHFALSFFGPIMLSPLESLSPFPPLAALFFPRSTTPLRADIKHPTFALPRKLNSVRSFNTFCYLWQPFFFLRAF